MLTPLQVGHNALNAVIGNIYVANVGNITAPTQLYVDGTFYDIAHYSNTGYLLATANSTTSPSDPTGTHTVIDSDLTLSADQIVGATVMTRAVSWFVNGTTATAYDSSTKTITLNGNVYNASITMPAKYGFYLANKLWMLDSPGEWYYDSGAGKLYLWAPGSDDPNNHTVEVSNHSYDIYDSYKNYVTIQNFSGYQR